MIRSENAKKSMRKSIFRTNHTYHNCLLESSHLENPSVLIGWWSGIRMASTLGMRFGLYHDYAAKKLIFTNN